jgi:hypothetical protein
VDLSGIETYYEDGRWRNKAYGGECASSTHATKGEASLVGLTIARYRGVDHVIRNQDGTVATRVSYRNEPYPTEI